MTTADVNDYRRLSVNRIPLVRTKELIFIGVSGWSTYDDLICWFNQIFFPRCIVFASNFRVILKYLEILR
jgi:hypothetical protein